MNRLHRNNKNYTFQGIDQTDEVYNLSDENWKDDTLENGIGDVDGSDPSMAGYNKGWQEEPYEQRYYASKMAAKETIDISNTVENYANEILSLWAETDGPLQNFFEGFTMNKFDNKMKKQIAEAIRNQGYEVYPILDDRRNRYAKLDKLSKNTPDELLNYYKNKCNNLKSINSLLNDVMDLKKIGHKISTAEMNGLLQYYLEIYPEEYSKLLTSDNFKKNTDIKEFEDIQLSDESLDALEDVLNEQSTPIYNGPGVNEEDTDRDDIGVPPNQYEVFSKRLKKKK